jgi:hypothetical protein
MSVVIMALAWDGSKARPRGVVAACDHLLSADTSKVNPMYAKVVDLAPTWLLGYAGDPAHFWSIAWDVINSGVGDKPSHDVIAKIKAIYRTGRKMQIEDRLLRPYGLDMDSFLERGLSVFGEVKFNALCERVEKYDLGIELVLGGWSKNDPRDAHIVTIVNPGASYDHTLIGTASIGMGAPIAQGHLDAVFVSTRDTEVDALYRCLEAKFMAEAAPSVGQDTTLMIITPEQGKEMGGVSDENIRAFRSLWDARRQEVAPDLSKVLEIYRTSTFIGRRTLPSDPTPELPTPPPLPE